MIQELLNLPILQIISLILVAGLAERMGIPVVSWIGNLLKLKNGNGKDIEELKGQIKATQENHLYHINNKLDRLAVNTDKILFILDEIRIQLREKK